MVTDRVLLWTIAISGAFVSTATSVVLSFQGIDLAAVLQDDARRSNKELAAATGIAPSTCSERVKRLEAEGVLLGSHAIVDPRALGIGLRAMVAIRLSRQWGSRAVEMPPGGQGDPPWDLLRAAATPHHTHRHHGGAGWAAADGGKVAAAADAALCGSFGTCV